MQQYYHDLNCPLDIFEEIYLGGSTELLLIEGKYNESDANLAWMELYDMYSDSVKSNKNNTAFTKANQMKELVAKYAMIKNCLWLIYQTLEINILNKATGLKQSRHR